MARVAGVEIPDNKQILFSLRYVYGIGHTTARKILAQAQIDETTKVRDLSDAELVRMRAIVENEHTVEGDLRREVRGNIQRLVEINCYRGNRHRRVCPCAASARRPTRGPGAARVERWPAGAGTAEVTRRGAAERRPPASEGDMRGTRASHPVCAGASARTCRADAPTSRRRSTTP